MRIGLVDDSDEDLRVLGRLLGRVAPEIELERYPTADAVLDALSTAGLAALLVDLNLPLMRGYELVERVRTLDAFAAIPIVILSGSDRDADVDAAYAAGANAYVHKPLDTAELTTALATLVAWLRLIKLPGGARAEPRGAWA